MKKVENEALSFREYMNGVIESLSVIRDVIGDSDRILPDPVPPAAPNNMANVQSGCDEVDLDLDPPIASLVHALNELPGVDTFSSCGGHEDWEDRAFSAKPPDEFSVSFDVEPTSAGWQSLDLLTWAAGHYIDEDPDCDPDDVALAMWPNGDPDAPYDSTVLTVCFQVDGRNNADPGVLAGIIARAAGLVG